MEDEIQVNPDLEPLWALPSRVLERQETIEYTGCFFGSKCKNLMNGQCRRLHPRHAEIIATITNPDNERAYRQVTHNTQPASDDFSYNTTQPNTQGSQDVRYNIDTNPHTYNVLHHTGTKTQTSHRRIPPSEPKYKVRRQKRLPQRRQAQYPYQSTNDGWQDTARKLRTDERTRIPEPSLTRRYKGKYNRVQQTRNKLQRNICRGLMGQVLRKYRGDKTREFNNVFHNLSNTKFSKEERTVLALGLKFKPPGVAGRISTVKTRIDTYCSNIRKLKIKAYCGELNKAKHPLYGRIGSYIYKLHYKEKSTKHLDSAICESFGIFAKCKAESRS